jgi:hypothetical protein
MPRRTTDIVAELKQHLAKARRFHAEVIEASATREAADKTELERAWQCGKELNVIKESLGHGNWLMWLNANWPELPDRTAQVYMKIDRDNPNAQRVADLKFDSIRKYAIAKVPKKQKVDEPGDQSFSKPENHSTVVNELARLFQRIDAGQQVVDEEELRRDFRPAYERLQRLYGDA